MSVYMSGMPRRAEAAGGSREGSASIRSGAARGRGGEKCEPGRAAGGTVRGGGRGGIAEEQVRGKGGGPGRAVGCGSAAGGAAAAAGGAEGAAGAGGAGGLPPGTFQRQITQLFQTVSLYAHNRYLLQEVRDAFSER